MTEIETHAKRNGRTLLTLLTTKESVAEENFYEKVGYVRIGVLPESAVSPDGTGRRVDGVYFYRDLTKVDGTK